MSAIQISGRVKLSRELRIKQVKLTTIKSHTEVACAQLLREIEVDQLRKKQVCICIPTALSSHGLGLNQNEVVADRDEDQMRQNEAQKGMTFT